MTYKLFLDDVRHPKEIYPNNWHDWAVVRSYEDFVKYVYYHGIPYEVSFDHDLEERHYPPTCDYSTPTGKDCAAYLANLCRKYKETSCLEAVYVHSFNPDAYPRILEEFVGIPVSFKNLIPKMIIF